MAKILATILISLICISLHSVHADTFKCTDEPSVCKTKFGTQFEKDFKGIHLAGVRGLLTTYIDNFKAIKSELPAGDSYIKPTQECIDKVSRVLQKLQNENLSNEQIKEVITQVMNDMSWDVKVVPNSENFTNLLKKHNLREALVNVMRKTGTDTGNLWAEMYSGLRETDIKTYPEYAEVNEHMNNLRGKGTSPGKSTDFTMAAEILKTKFNIPYFEVVTAIS